MAVAMKKVKTTGRKFQVLNGTAKKSVGGLTKKDLTTNKSGKVVSKKKSAIGKKNTWMVAMAKARKVLKVKGFVLIGKGKEGKALLAKAREFHAASKK